MKTKAPFVALCIVTIAGLSAILAFESVYQISVRPRLHGSVFPAGTSTTAQPSRHSQLTLRLTDSGGVGIPVGQWQSDYSHDRRTFREVMLLEPPYVDIAGLRRVEPDWQSYVTRMADYGNNAIAVPLLLELIDFDRVPDAAGTPGGRRIYGRAACELNSELPARTFGETIWND